MRWSLPFDRVKSLFAKKETPRREPRLQLEGMTFDQIKNWSRTKALYEAADWIEKMERENSPFLVHPRDMAQSLRRMATLP